ncbi:uncharacterized protein LTR77_004547 [Saxophila tyrrhenica]|uniref:Uncharacterized protein n=1 Tax=Saxophila tyrrhenica TaxID=1690608 RepID=A0AAV9PH90_9PEZI|nr:hypothetical protein LTR77_004547 [Saxophila tyrrhenica]
MLGSHNTKTPLSSTAASHQKYTASLVRSKLTQNKATTFTQSCLLEVVRQERRRRGWPGVALLTGRQLQSELAGVELVKKSQQNGVVAPEAAQGDQLFSQAVAEDLKDDLGDSPAEAELSIVELRVARQTEAAAEQRKRRKPSEANTSTADFPASTIDHAAAVARSRAIIEASRAVIDRHRTNADSGSGASAGESAPVRQNGVHRVPYSITTERLQSPDDERVTPAEGWDLDHSDDEGHDPVEGGVARDITRVVYLELIPVPELIWYTEKRPGKLDLIDGILRSAWQIIGDLKAIREEEGWSAEQRARHDSWSDTRRFLREDQVAAYAMPLSVFHIIHRESTVAMMATDREKRALNPPAEDKTASRSGSASPESPRGSSAPA